MFTIIGYGYEFLVEFIPFLIAMILMEKTSREHPGTSGTTPRRLFSMVFALYLICVFHVTGAGTLYQALECNWALLGRRFNYIPFSRTIHIPGYLLNVVMFVPFGFLTAVLWKDLASIGHILLSGLSFSALIELSQFFSMRGTDVDDLITNTAGAAAGFLCYRLWNRITGSRYQCSSPPAALPVYILTIFLGRFFLFHYRGLISLWYGY